MPRLWKKTIEAHRREVREAITRTTAALVAEHGLHAVTMAQIAEETEVGRATLYKYFPDVEAILFAWHERQVEHHLHHLVEVRDRAGPSAAAQLEAVLLAYALIRHEHRHPELAALVHRGEHIARAEQRLHEFLRHILGDGAASGELRSDIPPCELASYCLHALGAAVALRSKAAVRRLVAVTLTSVQPVRSSAVKSSRRSPRRRRP